VTEIWSEKQIQDLQGVRQKSGIWKYALPGPGRASTPNGQARITGESYSQLKMQATGPGKLTIRDRNMPGWVAKVDGAHTKMEGTTWMELDLPAGDHRIELNYVPPGFMTGVFLAVPAWILLILLAFRSFVIGKAPRKPS
jgi:hypothetical protein